MIRFFDQIEIPCEAKSWRFWNGNRTFNCAWPYQGQCRLPQKSQNPKHWKIQGADCSYTYSIADTVIVQLNLFPVTSLLGGNLSFRFSWGNNIIFLREHARAFSKVVEPLQAPKPLWKSKDMKLWTHRHHFHGEIIFISLISFLVEILLGNAILNVCLRKEF